MARHPWIRKTLLLLFGGTSGSSATGGGGMMPETVPRVYRWTAYGALAITGRAAVRRVRVEDADEEIAVLLALGLFGAE